MALPEEGNGKLPFPVVYTGCGKVNATIGTVRAILEYKPDWVINYGSAGGVTMTQGKLVNITSFYQRDMNAVGLGFKKYDTPFDPVGSILKVPNKLEKYFGEGYICGTGDNFVQCQEESVWDVVDMEAYAIAKACQSFKVDFSCVKYISDNADSQSEIEWKTNLNLGWSIFINTFLTNYL
jgi:adenosylhomocysteine nucleosidase